MGLIVLGLLGILIGGVVAWIAMSYYDEETAFIGMLAIIIGVFFVIVGGIEAGEEDSKTDRHVKVTFEEACRLADGAYTVLDNEETCIVKE